MNLSIHTAEEALYIACEMEKRAIRMYERMLLLFRTPENQKMLNDLLSDERSHLKRFREMMEGAPPMAEEALLLSAEAAGILFRGGLTEALRKGAVGTSESLLKYAMEQEEIAVKTYLGFADACAGKAAQMLRDIAGEEGEHLRALQEMA